MGIGNDNSGLYNPIWIDMWLESKPLWKRVRAMVFEKHKFTKQDYLDWVFKNRI